MTVLRVFRWFLVIAMLLCIGWGLRDMNGCERSHYVYSDSHPEYVEFKVKCKCGNVLDTGIPMYDKFWPLKYTCRQCGMKYTITREQWTAQE